MMPRVPTPVLARHLPAVAVAAVLALGACSAPSDGGGPAAAARPPSGAPAPTAPPGPAAPSGSPRPLDDLPPGAAPRVGYVVGTTYVDPDGGDVELPRSRFVLGGAAAFDGGLLVDEGRYFEGTTALSVVTADGVEELDGCASAGRQAVVRLGLDGSLERTTPVLRPGRGTGHLLVD
ncbi:hypothetical protein [Nocardioides sp. 1609]|uniref:hypothetical protein n=1 Tax=Nocardioides sp. 1609 TaxID=2508327 RepID=UPI00107067D8|nr:hypothetical protein [Nocardioides sp. 1609]